MRETRLMQGVRKCAIRWPAVADQHAPKSSPRTAAASS
jgi:hypothetical protein